MSKIGKKPIIIPDDVQVKVAGRELEIKGKGGTLTFKIPAYVKAEIKDKSIWFNPENNSKQAQANWGTSRALTNNALVGVAKEFEKVLEIEGIGYRVGLEGDTLVLNLGFSHPVRVQAPEGIKFEVVKNTIKVSGINKELVGRAAAHIRALKKVEPYKGKGIKYRGEIVRRKTGKKVAGTTK